MTCLFNNPTLFNSRQSNFIRQTFSNFASNDKLQYFTGTRKNCFLFKTCVQCTVCTNKDNIKKRHKYIYLYLCFSS